MDRRLLAGLLFLSAAVLSWQATRRAGFSEPSNLLEIVEMLRHDKQYIGDRLPEECQVGYRPVGSTDERRPWRHDLVCVADKTVAEITLRAHGGRLIDQAGPVRVRNGGGCFPEGLRRFARSEQEAWPSPQGCWSLRRSVGDGVATVACCPEEDAFVVTVNSQLSEFKGGVLESLEKGLGDVLTMREDGRVPDEILTALYRQRVLRVKEDLLDYKLKASTRNVPLIDALLEASFFERLREAYSKEKKSDH